MKAAAKESEKDFGKDLRTLDQLPTKTKELLLLQDQAEKSIGQEYVALHKAARDKFQYGIEGVVPKELSHDPGTPPSHTLKGRSPTLRAIDPG